MKGLVYVELIAKGPVRDAHSSLAVLIENPAWRLIYALNTMLDQTARYNQRLYRKCGHLRSKNYRLQRSPLTWKNLKEYGVSKFVADAKGTDIKKALVGMPTCNIAGIHSGYI